MYPVWMTASGSPRTFFRVRVAVLLMILVVVVLYAFTDVQGRRARNDWKRTLRVGLVVVRLGPVDDAAVASLRERVHTLENVLAAEAERHGSPGGAHRPFDVEMFGPVDVTERPPALEATGLIDLARYTLAKRQYIGRIDDAAKIDARGLDARIYLVAREGRAGGTNFVEGVSEDGGRTGFVEVDLDESMVDFALFVFAHELFHTLGATDKYDASGHVLVPAGLAEPNLVPQLPQRYAELMARSRPVAPGREVPPDRLDELRVGVATATEIGWRTAPP
jgi:hypothetical protein